MCTNELNWHPSQEELDKIILPFNTEITKLSDSLINKFKCSPEYVAEILKDFAEAIVSSCPESNKSSFSCKFYWELSKFHYYLKIF